MILFKTLIFTLVGPGSFTVWIPYFLLSSHVELFPFKAQAFRPVGAVLMALGVVFYGWCAWNFAFVGRGTPAIIDPPKKLVLRGLYRFVRNPMYIGMSLIMMGESLFFSSSTLGVYALLIWIGFHLFVLCYEEPHLKKKFGASYEEYCRTIPRWIPRLKI